METIFLGINIVDVAALLFSVIFTAGVVWRVEHELDISYKLFLAAIVFILAAEILDLYYGLDNQLYVSLIVKILRMLFAAFFLAGVLFMRDIIRHLDGEKRKRKCPTCHR
jgi:hypothetical protein